MTTPPVAAGPPGSAAVAAGSRATADAAAEVLRAGGNAVDAAVAAGFAAAVAEPGLTSLGGGGFLLTGSVAGADAVHDFFVDTPGRGGGRDVEPRFTPVTVSFAGAEQEFHVGAGSVAVPGVLAGYLQLQRERGRLPVDLVVAPAVRLAREGVVVEPETAEVFSLLHDVFTLTPEARRVFAPDGRLPRAGDRMRLPDYAELLDVIAAGSVTSPADPPFGPAAVAAVASGGGQLTLSDLQAYRVRAREPLTLEHRGARLDTNPPPSFGGSIVVDALARLGEGGAGAMADNPAAVVRALAAATEAQKAAWVRRRSVRGTTHVSVVDADGGVASMTTSNGSCSGVVVPGTGVHMNNMLGESDLHPEGLGASTPGLRIGSMMAPSLLTRPDGALVVLGSGGSERIRSALVAVVSRLVDDEPLARAVTSPRWHLGDDGVLQAEPGLTDDLLDRLAAVAPVHVWDRASLYFGGVHAVRRDADGAVTAVGDPRRGGAVAVVRP